MKYVSIDIETTGLDPKRHQILELAMVHEDTENIRPLEQLPCMTMLFFHEDHTWQPEALEMNHGVLRESLERGFPPEQAWTLVKETLWGWGYYQDGRKAVAAGKNVAGFDLQFFDPEIKPFFHHRTIDPGSVFFDFKADRPPSLGALLGRPVEHRALDDALATIEVLRRKYT